MLPDTKFSERPIWFAAKRYGWGWGLPVAWQGWVVLLVWMAMVIGIAPILAGRHRIVFGIFTAAMVAALLGICYLKGERPRWRWGK
jgi:hypothetical protein